MIHSKRSVARIVSVIGLLTGLHATLYAVEDSKVAQFNDVPSESGKVYGITREWWPQFDREVTIAATSFLAYGSKGTAPSKPVPQGNLSLWLQEMKVPPLGEQEILVSATVVPMLCAAWQALQDPDQNVEDPDEGKFRWDGTCKPNPKLIGSWSQLCQVATIDEFKPGMALRSRGKPPLQRIAFSDGGKTSEPLHLWSGEVLMNLADNQAQRMAVKSLAGSDYLFIETGGISTRHPAGWQSPWYVFKR